MAKILHLATDEKFISAAEYLYEKAFPGQNKFFIVLPNKKNYKLKYVKEKENYFFYKDSNKALQQISSKLKEFDLVVLHGFDLFKSRVVDKNKDILYNWILWGAEIYDKHKLFRNTIYGDKTKKINLKHEKGLKKTLRPLFHKLKYGFFDNWGFQHKTIYENINNLSIIHREDYELFINNKVINKKVKHLKFTYYPIEFILDENKNKVVSDNNILLGNSASKSNNHIEAIDILKNIELEERKVIVPLSYGQKEYADIIINYGNEQLSNSFTPLSSFLSLSEYNNVIQSCGIVVMNHYRQQAVGNILASLWMGAKVFLDERNTFYHYLKRIGCYVYSIKELSHDNLELLTDDKIRHNRDIIVKEISTDVIVDVIKKDITSIIKGNK